VRANVHRLLGPVCFVGAAFVSCGGVADSTVSPAACPPGYTCVAADAGTDASARGDGATMADAEPIPEIAGALDAVSASFAPFSHNVLLAIRSQPLGSLIMISDAPTSAVHIRSADGQDTVVPLTRVPRSVALFEGGTLAAVAGDWQLVLVDVSTGALLKQCQPSFQPAQVMPADDHWVYVTAKAPGNEDLRRINLDTCNEYPTGPRIYGEPGLTMHTSRQVIYAVGGADRSTRIERCDIRLPFAPECADLLRGKGTGAYEFCGKGWASADGRRLFTRCGITLNLGWPAVTEPGAYAGRLTGISRLTDLYEVSEQDRLVIVRHGDLPYPSGEAKGDTVIELFESKNLVPLSKYKLPGIPFAGGLRAAHGRFVFSNANVSTVDVVVESSIPTDPTKVTGLATLKF
jgi:hypothetical protein